MCSRSNLPSFSLKRTPISWSKRSTRFCKKISRKGIDERIENQRWKTANTQYPIHDLLKRRWSRAPSRLKWSSRRNCAACWKLRAGAPSSYNAQPWSFFIAMREDESEYQRLLDCLVPGNALWAQHAPVLLLSVAKFNFDHNGARNRHAWYDVGQAVADLTLQATALGLVIHQMAGFDSPRAREQFHIPEDHEPVAMIALGYPGSPESLPEQLREKELQPHSRKALDSFVFTGEWGKIALLVREQ